MPEARWKRWMLVLLFWTLLGLFFASQTGMTYLYRQGHAPWGFIVQLTLSEWYIWAALTPAVVWLARRIPLSGHRWLRGLAVHIPASLAFGILKIVVEGQTRQQLLGIPGQMNPMDKIHLAFLTYWAIVGVSHAFDYYRKYREREVAAAQLETQLAQAQLQALQAQLQPHFLFNTLHAISTLMHRDVDAAERMISLLGDLLRLTLEHAGRQEVPLRQELDFAGRYLEIQRIRFPDRLTVETGVASEALDALVPHLLLQPLVENAVRHGIAPRAQPGAVRITARADAGLLRLEVRDDGPGFTPGLQPEGLGLKNTRARLQRLYGTDHFFDLEAAPQRGVCVRMAIPLRLVGQTSNSLPPGPAPPSLGRPG